MARKTNRNKLYTVRNWCDEYLFTYKCNVKPKTVKDYELVLKAFCNVFGDFYVHEVTQIDIQRYINSLSGKSFSYVHKMLFLLKAVFKAAVQNGLININPAEMIVMPETTQASHRVITDEERKALIKVASYHYAGNYINLMLFCGLRPSETINVQGKDIDVSKGILHVRGTKNRSADRLVPIPDRIIDALSDFKDEDYVVVGRSGKPVKWASLKTLWTSIRKELEKYIDTDVRPYDLRHTFCTDICQTSIPIATIAKIMGHSDTTMIMNVYFHATDTAIQSARRALNSLKLE